MGLSYRMKNDGKSFSLILVLSSYFLIYLQVRVLELMIFSSIYFNFNFYILIKVQGANNLAATVHEKTEFMH